MELGIGKAQVRLGVDLGGDLGVESLTGSLGRGGAKVKRIVVAGLVLLAGCSTENRAGVETGKVAETQSPAATQKTFAQGEKVETKTGNFVTFHAYGPAKSDNQFIKPKEGKEYAAIDMEFCAGLAVEEGAAGANPFDFAIQLPDNTRGEQTIDIKEPGLHDTTLPPNECVRGWITFEIPAGQKATFVLYNGEDTIVKWAVP